MTIRTWYNSIRKNRQPVVVRPIDILVTMVISIASTLSSFVSTAAFTTLGVLILVSLIGRVKKELSSCRQPVQTSTNDAQGAQPQ
jgi:hypothetical protein